jgi:hypothetical protein
VKGKGDELPPNDDKKTPLTADGLPHISRNKKMPAEPNYGDAAAGLAEIDSSLSRTRFVYTIGNLYDDYETDHPILAAFWEGEGLEGVRAAVEADPGVIRRRTEDLWGGGGFPSTGHFTPTSHSGHVADDMPDVVRYLLEQYPESIRERTPEGVGWLLPVHSFLLNHSASLYHPPAEERS